MILPSYLNSLDELLFLRLTARSPSSRLCFLETVLELRLCIHKNQSVIALFDSIQAG